jgi:hypothetical protein
VIRGQQRLHVISKSGAMNQALAVDEVTLNLVPACNAYNLRKADHTALEFMASRRAQHD